VDCRYFELNVLISLISILYLGYSGQNGKMTCLVRWECIWNSTHIFLTYSTNLNCLHTENIYWLHPRSLCKYE